METGKLSPKQQPFVDAYVAAAGNAAAAARTAGYAKDSSNVTGSRLLASVNAKTVIERKARAIAEQVELDQQWVLRRLMRIAVGDANRLNTVLVNKRGKTLRYAVLRLVPRTRFSDETFAAYRQFARIISHRDYLKVLA